MSAMVTRATPFGHDQDNLSVLCPFFKDCATNLARSLVRYLAPASCINNLQVIFALTPRADDMFHRKNMAPDSQERQPLSQVGSLLWPVRTLCRSLNFPASAVPIG